MGWDYCYIGVEKQGDRFVLKQVVCKDAEQQNKETSTRLMELPVSRKLEAGLFPNYERDIYLRVKVGKNGVCHFHYSLDGKKYQRPVNRLLHVKASGLALKSVCSVRLRSVKIEVGLMLTGFA